MYYGYITRLKDLHAHPNADKLQIGSCFGNQVIVSLEYVNDQLGLYLPGDGQVSEEFGQRNNLLRKKDENGKNIGGYIDPVKRNIKTVRLRGEVSDGIFLPLECLEYTGAKLLQLQEGDRIDILNGHEICKKYIPPVKPAPQPRVSHTRKKKVDIAPLFKEHVDTEQLAYNLDAFHAEDQIEISLKMHGTSARTAYLPVFAGYKSDNKLWNALLKALYGKSNLRPAAQKLLDEVIKHSSPVYEWGYVTGTRRTVCNSSFEGGFYGSDNFREQHAKVFEGKLWRGETVYSEIVGFTNSGTPIMGSVSNKSISDKEFTQQYGDTTTFSYGCSPEGKDAPKSDMYVYRMTLTNEEGFTVEYTPDFMRYRCEQMGVKCVPSFWQGYIPPDEWAEANGEDNIIMHNRGQTPGEWVKALAEQLYDGPDPVGKSHVREGVVVRILNRPSFTVYKHKNDSFKMLAGIIVEQAAESGDIIDSEVASEL